MTDYDRGFADGAKEKDILIRRARAQAFEEVLEIINKMDKENEKYNDILLRIIFKIEYQDFRERVLALKDGEQE